MAVISTLAVALTAKTSKFRSGFRRSRREVGKFRGAILRARGALAGMSGVMGGLKTKLLGLATAAAGGGLALLVKRQFAVIDASAKMSKRLKISIDDLEGLRHAAGLSGVELAAVDKGIEKMARNIGEVAKLGTGEAKDAFEAIGLSAAKLNAMDPTAQFKAIADGMRGLSTQSEKAAVAAKIFGRSGVGLINVLDQGSDSLTKMIAENKRLQGSLSAVDAGKIEEANDSIARMGKAFSGIIKQLAITLAPAVTAFAKNFAEKFVQMRESVKSFVVGALEDLLKFDESGGLGQFVTDVKAGFAGIVLVAQAAHSALKVVVGTLMAAMGMIEDFRTRGVKDAQWAKDTKQLKALIALRDETDREMANLMPELRGGAEKYAKTLEARIASLQDRLASQSSQGALTKAGLEMMGSSGDFAKNYQAALDKVKFTPGKSMLGDLKAVIADMKGDAEKAGKMSGGGFLDGFVDGMKSKAQLWIGQGVAFGKSFGKAATSKLLEGIKFVTDEAKKVSEEAEASVDVTTPAALTRGSAEAFSVGAQAQFGAQDKMARESAQKAETQRDEIVVALKQIDKTLGEERPVFTIQ